METFPLRIGGRSADGARVRDVTSPFDGRVVARVAVAGPAEFERALASAAAADG